MERGSIVCLGGAPCHVINMAPPRNRLHPELIDNGHHANGIQSQYGKLTEPNSLKFLNYFQALSPH